MITLTDRTVHANLMHKISRYGQLTAARHLTVFFVLIEITYPWRDRIGLVCKDEGLLRQLPFNRMVAPGCGIFGTFFLCGLGEEDLTDLPDDMADKYMKLLYQPQILLQTTDGACVLPLVDCEGAENNGRSS